MALAGGLQYIDNLALRFSLHGLEDTFAGKPTFCFSWSEPFDLDSVAGKLASNPKRSRSFPITLPKRIPESADKQNTDKLEQKKDETKSPLRVLSVKEHHSTLKTTTRPLSETRSTCIYMNVEEESSDEELCDIMLEQENIKINQDFSSVKKRAEPLEARGFEKSCEKRKQPNCRKRYLKELDTSPGFQAKRPRPRLDFDKVLLSRTKYSEEESIVTKKVSYFAPIVGSDSDEDNV